jgi:DNA-directed RNA polymerase subunit beta'
MARAVRPSTTDILPAVSGREAVHKYMVNEVQRLYCSPGVTINDKHIEIIVGGSERARRIDGSA